MQTNIFSPKNSLNILFILSVTSFTASWSVEQIRFVMYDLHGIVISQCTVHFVTYKARVKK